MYLIFKYVYQTGGECCGIQSELDWKETAAFNGTGLKPLSCCPNIDDPNLCKLYAPDSYTLGCTDTVNYFGAVIDLFMNALFSVATLCRVSPHCTVNIPNLSHHFIWCITSSNQAGEILLLILYTWIKHCTFYKKKLIANKLCAHNINIRGSDMKTVL